MSNFRIIKSLIGMSMIVGLFASGCHQDSGETTSETNDIATDLPGTVGKLVSG